VSRLQKPAPPPDRAAALEQYRRRADLYDLELQLLEPVRREAIARLAPRRGEVVLDVGCGTGMSLPMLRDGVGARGRILGIEQSPDMIAKARQRVAQHAWRNVDLLCSPVESASIPVIADAAIFHFTHDIVRRDDALTNVMEHLKPGARVISAGLKWAPPWAVLTNLFVLPAALHSVTSFEGLLEPWSMLAGFLGGFRVDSLMAGGVYIASGTLARP